MKMCRLMATARNPHPTGKYDTIVYAFADDRKSSYDRHGIRLLGGVSLQLRERLRDLGVDPRDIRWNLDTFDTEDFEI